MNAGGVMLLTFSWGVILLLAVLCFLKVFLRKEIK